MDSESSAALRNMKEKFVKEIKDAGVEASEAVKGTAHAAAENAASARRSVEGRLGDVKSGLEDVRDVAWEQGSSAFAATQDYCRAHPYKALGLAVVIGLFAGSLMKRRAAPPRRGARR